MGRICVVANQWLDDVSNYSSLHGLSWIKRTKNSWLKGMLVMFSFATIIALPIFVIGTYVFIR